MQVQASFHIPALRQALEDNLRHLVAQNMLEKGHGQVQAEKEIGTLLELLRNATSFSMRLDRADDQVQLNLELGLAP